MIIDLEQVILNICRFLQAELYLRDRNLLNGFWKVKHHHRHGIQKDYSRIDIALVGNSRPMLRRRNVPFCCYSWYEPI